MIKFLSLGSVVRLHNGDTKIMIISRFPLFDKNGEIGFFDYAACIYPNGNTDNQAYFFNQEDIAEVYFEGYIDETEEEAQKVFEREKANIKYPHFKVEDLD